MKKIVIGIVAHVDAGKTTLSESMLYLSGKIRKLGRVDHGNAFLDYDGQERDRGITIFSKQARFSWKETEFVLIDTPGHADFSTEMERTLQVLDYAIVVINGLDGVQNHTQTIWKLLEHYHVPTFLFMNKMDITPLSQENLLDNIKDQLDEHCIDFTQFNEETYENIALVDEDVLNDYLNHQTISDIQIATFIQQRRIFPVYFGSALKLQGVEQFLNQMNQYCIEKEYDSSFSAIVYKITHDGQNRLTHMKITGGTLKTKDKIKDEKVDQIRLYSGNRYEMIQEVKAGDICVIKGLKNIQAGEIIGNKQMQIQPVISSYIQYRIVLPEGCDVHAMYKNLQQLSQEDPSLHIHYHQQLKEIRIQLMGEIQIEILKNMIKERFDVDVDFDQGEILYKETILEPVEGVGHFEPLRHYAEVHVLLEPLENGKGLQFESDCPEDILDRHWQRLILTHLQEKEHIGVLTGSPITDMKITLLTGRAHQKHTEGGDFRQATYRAVRQGLKMAKSVLLEPYYQYELKIPKDCLSRALYDLEGMHGTFEIHEMSEEIIICGSAPVICMQNYQNDVISYSKGRGQLSCVLKGYDVCHNQEEIIDTINYNSENDLDNPTGSIFCSHGAGFYVNWDEVRNHMHVSSQWSQNQNKKNQSFSYSSSLTEDDELEEIFTRTYGPIKRKTAQQLGYQNPVEKQTPIQKAKPQCLLVDGYNVIHAWSELKEIAKDNLEGARLRLMDMMCNYQGYKKCLLILVFDAYKVKGNLGTSMPYHNIHIVYTKEAQTADMYIERATHEMADRYDITVATSDALEQLIVTGAGAYRMSSRELRLDLEYINKTKQQEYHDRQDKSRNFLLEDIKNYKDE